MYYRRTKEREALIPIDEIGNLEVDNNDYDNNS